VYTTGLFKPAAGPDSNLPILRQGNIAMLPKEQIQTELGYADVYLMEVRSLGGLSGSPVFVRPSIDFKVADGRGKQRDAFAAGLGFVLLGLMHGHWDSKESEINKANFAPDRKRGVNMGIGIVVPATKNFETINQPELVAMRKEAEERATRRMVPGMDSAKREDHDTQITKTGFEVPVPSSKQFFDGLKKASRKVQAPKT